MLARNKRSNLFCLVVNEKDRITLTTNVNVNIFIIGQDETK